MDERIGVVLMLTAFFSGLLALAPRVSAWLVRWRASRLPPALSVRMREEWLAELAALPGRVSQLAFAIALALTRRHSFSAEDESLPVSATRSPLTVASLGGWPSVVVITTVVAAGIAYAGSFLIQPVYRSHARLLVQPQGIPARFVEPADRLTFKERVRAARSIILDDRTLDETILSFDLYKSDRQDTDGGRDAAIARMRRDITVTMHPDRGAFEIAYVSTDPQMAIGVAERLASLFLKANARNRDDIRSALRSLDGEIASVRSRLLRRSGIERAEEYERLKATYRDLLMKKEQVMLSIALDVRQLGEQIKVADAARLPDTPVSPDRTRWTLLGAAIGFCLGIALIIAGRDGSSRWPRKMLART